MNNPLEITKKLLDHIEKLRVDLGFYENLKQPIEFSGYHEKRLSIASEIMANKKTIDLMAKLRKEGRLFNRFLKRLETSLFNQSAESYNNLMPDLEATLSGNKLKIVTELELTKRLISYNSKILVELGFYENLEKYQLSAGYVCSRELMADRILRNAETQGLMDDLHQKGGAFENYRKNFEAAIYSSNCGRYVQMYANFIFESLEKNSRFGSVETKPIRSLANSFFGNRSVNKKFNTIINGIFHRSKST